MIVLRFLVDGSFHSVAVESQVESEGPECTYSWRYSISDIACYLYFLVGMYMVGLE